MKLRILAEKLKDLDFGKIGPTISKFGLALALGYFSAVLVGDIAVVFLMSNVKSSMPRKLSTIGGVTPVKFKMANYRNIRKAITDRNVFNETGEFPDEVDPAFGQPVEQTKKTDFDINANCVASKLGLKLIGTIYVERGGESFATVQEKSFPVDVYREGEQIIDHEDALIVKIERTRIVINNAGTKECIELENKGKDRITKVYTPPSSKTPSSNTGGGDDVTLDEKYIRDALGPGFGSIITQARIVPNTSGNQMNGFKIFAIKKGSLFEKIGLKNGDVITQVNDTSLKQPDQGFALYQSLQDDEEISIRILRKGSEPKTLTVRVK